MAAHGRRREANVTRATTAGILAVALLLAAGGGEWLAAQSEQVGEVVSSVGTTVVVRTDGIQERLQGKGAIRLFEHDVIRADAGVRALIELKEGIRIALNEKTTATLHSRWEKARGTTRILRLSVGEAWVKTGDGPKRLEVETPVATAVVRETEFNMKVEPDGQSVLTVVQGVVEFGTAFGTCPIRTNTVSTGVRGKRCTRPAPIDVAPVLNWSRDLVK
jgi:ferric-dicitrate binding protein FerR (iron transport regulator)